MLHFVRLCLHWHGAVAESTVLEVKPLVVPMGSFPEVSEVQDVFPSQSYL